MLKVEEKAEEPQGWAFDAGIAEIEWSPEDDASFDGAFHPAFLKKLVQWLRSLCWATSTVDGKVYDISWLELFWQWVFTTRELVPVLVGGRWLRLADCPEVVCCLPSVATMLQVWRRGVAAVRGCGLFPDWGRLQCTESAKALGAGESVPGLVGRVFVDDVVLCDLRSQFLRSSGVAGFRLPSFWHN